MKKLTTATDLGGAPIYKNDLREVFNVELWDAIEALLSPFDSDTEGLVISGCVVSANGGGFDITSGIVYLNGEFMKMAAITAQSFTKYIAPATPTNDTRTFSDSTSNVVTINSTAEIVASAPGSGQYIAISSLTDLDDRRCKKQLNSNGQVLGSASVTGWNMDTTATNNITHGLTSTQAQTIKILSLQVRQSGAGFPRELNAYDGTLDNGVVSGGMVNLDATNISVNRVASGSFDTALFNDATVTATFLYTP